jgi:hypothetical protein
MFWSFLGYFNGQNYDFLSITRKCLSDPKLLNGSVPQNHRSPIHSMSWELKGHEYYMKVWVTMVYVVTWCTVLDILGPMSQHVTMLKMKLGLGPCLFADKGLWKPPNQKIASICNNHFFSKNWLTSYHTPVKVLALNKRKELNI